MEDVYLSRNNGYFAVNNISQDVYAPEPVIRIISRSLAISTEEIDDVILLKESLDARKKGKAKKIISAAVKLKSSTIPHGFIAYPSNEINWNGGNRKINERPVIAGCGPAGLFLAYGLIKKGYRPIIIEQGKRIANRDGDVAILMSSGNLDVGSNFVFGEGGAGTYSDGKLTARNVSPITDEVYRTFVKFGADPSISYQSRPHLGTDNLRRIIPAFSDYLVENGTQIIWDTAVTNIERAHKDSISIFLDNGDQLTTDAFFLATGHSADSVYRMLNDASVPMEVKTFAIGARIEHPSAFINEKQYGSNSLASMVGAASYRLSGWAEEGRGVYSFCVCPGGEIMNASSSKGRVVVNGMSNSKRDNEFTNGAIVVSVLPSDMPRDPIEVLEFRAELEKKCHRDFMIAPAQRAEDFIKGNVSRNIKSTYRPGIYAANLGSLLPDFVARGLHAGLIDFDRKIRGFISSGVLVAPETGTSSPVRILRDDLTMESKGMRGLFPIGEGSGYAGGIISSAADGLRAALLFAQHN